MCDFVEKYPLLAPYKDAILATTQTIAPFTWQEWQGEGRPPLWQSHLGGVRCLPKLSWPKCRPFPISRRKAFCKYLWMAWMTVWGWSAMGKDHFTAIIPTLLQMTAPCSKTFPMRLYRKIDKTRLVFCSFSKRKRNI